MSEPVERLRAAYRAGKRSSLTSVDADDACARFSRKHCAPHSPSVLCDLEHAWYDGFEHDCRDERPWYLARTIGKDCPHRPAQGDTNPAGPQCPPASRRRRIP